MEKKFCAHRGLSALMPENTLPAFAAALAMGADEIEFDVRLTKDNQLIVSHDGTLERISDGAGQLSDFKLEELQKLNIGVKHGWTVSFCTAEDVFRNFANKLTFNMHLKEIGENGFMITELKRLAEKYHAQESVYFAASPKEFDGLGWMQKLAPEIPRTAIQFPDDPMTIYEMVERFECSRVQFWLGEFDKEMIDRLHEMGVICNLYYADCEENYRKYFDMGIDTLLTNRMDLAADYRKKYM